MKNQTILSEEQLDEIKEIREQMNEHLLVIKTRGAFFNGQEIIIETVRCCSSNFEPTIIIDVADFQEYNTLLIPNGYYFESVEDKNYLYAYIDEVGKFKVKKDRGVLDSLFHDFKDIFKFGA